MSEALLEARVPTVPVEIDDVGADLGALRLLVLPNIAAMSEDQCRRVGEFIQSGGSVIATGETSRYDEWGDRRPDFALGAWLGITATGVHHGAYVAKDATWDAWESHSYLRLHPEIRAGVDGPRDGSEPEVAPRHAGLGGLEDTDLVPFGGRLEVVRLRGGGEVLATFVPPFPIYPPELSWLRQPTTTVPGIVIAPGERRVAYLAADLDRCYARDHQPDHARLITNLVAWGLGAPGRLSVKGPGLVDCQAYTQPGRAIVHLVNLTNPGAWRPPVTELLPVGPQRVSIRLDDLSIRPRTADLRVAGKRIGVTSVGDRFECTVEGLVDHEVVVLEDGR